jgi:hypothetical protein
MFRNLWVFLFLLVAGFALGQTTSNPFDLKFRPSNPSVFKNERPSVPDTPVTSKVITDKPLPTPKDTAKEIQSQVDTSKSTKSNPFELKEGETNTTVVPQEPVKVDPKPQSPRLEEKHRPSKGIQIFLLLISLLFLIFIVNVERSFVRDLWKVISNENYSSLHLRNQRNTMRQILLLMGYVVFIIQAGIFLYHTLVLFNYEGTLFDNVWACMLLVMVVYIVRHAVIGYLRWLFTNDKEMTLFSFDISIFNIMVGLVLLPINVLMSFGPDSLFKPLIIIGLIVVVIAYLMRQLRWMLTARHLITNSLFLFFVYLCAVEILPLWAISKYFW